MQSELRRRPSDWYTVTASASSCKIKGGRTRADKIGVGAGDDIGVATSKTQVWCTHTPIKSLSAPARR